MAVAVAVAVAVSGGGAVAVAVAVAVWLWLWLRRWLWLWLRLWLWLHLWLWLPESSPARAGPGLQLDPGCSEPRATHLDNSAFFDSTCRYTNNYAWSRGRTHFGWALKSSPKSKI